MWKLDVGQKDLIVARYLSGESSAHIARDFGIHSTNIRGILRRRGVQMRTNSEAQTRLPLNHEAFDVLTPEAAYWCGFIAADGTVVVFSYDTFNVAELTPAVIKKMTNGSVFTALNSIRKHPVRARAEIHAISSTDIGWGRDRPKSGLYLLLRQVHYLRNGTPIFTGDTYFVEGKFQFIIHRTV